MTQKAKVDKNSTFEKKELKKKSENISDWYTDVILKAELADYGPVRGTMVIRPYGFSIWEKVQEVFNDLIRQDGVQNAYFPLFIPHKLMMKEKDHVEGFSPELALVTIGGGKKLEEPLVVRPTSETIMYEMYSKWIKSWRDLPIKINQWNNVVRWEKRTYLFLRTMEFLWQEGHTAHAEEGEAIETALKALEWYRIVYEDYYAIPVISGVKSESEKFPGAKTTYAVEPLMPDGKALQAATSHNLGQNFSKIFDISFQDENGENKFVWQTSWGLSTRSLGGLFLVHGDDQGLIIPPKVAPIQVVIIPIYKSSQEDQELEIYIEKIFNTLRDRGIKVFIDNRGGYSVGRKFNDWEIKGVPIRIEIGEAEKKDNTVTVVRRDTNEKLSVSESDFSDEVYHLLDAIQENLFKKAGEFLRENTHQVSNYDEFKKIMSGKRGYIKAFWCEDAECEAKIKEETKATTRVRPLTEEESKGKCVHCGREAKHIWYFAQAY